MIAANLPTLFLAFGVLVLCVTTAVTTLSLPGLEWSSWRRHPRPTEDRRDDDVHSMYPPVLSRRVITGHPATLPAAAPPPHRTIGAIELPAAAARHNDVSTDRPLTTADAAEALIVQLIDDDPERMADLMMQWMRSDADDSSRSRRT